VTSLLDLRDVTLRKGAVEPPDPARYLLDPTRYDEAGYERPTLSDAHVRASRLVIDQSGVAASMLEVTERLWRLRPWQGRAAETVELAWRRLFGEAMPPPLLLHYVLYRGRELVVRAHRAGRLSVLDQTTGRHEIRRLSARWESVVNACTERAATGGPQASSHLKMAAATQHFLQQRAAL
jgi:hypothetical protein